MLLSDVILSEWPVCISAEPQKRCRPSQDVLVSALCMLSSKSSTESTASTHQTCPHVLPSLLSGVAVRRSTLALNDLQLLQPSTSTAAATATAEEVQALNQVNGIFIIVEIGSIYRQKSGDNPVFLF